MLCWSTQMTILVAFSTGRPRSYSSLARRQRRFFMSKTEEIRTLAPGSRVTEYEMKKSRFLAYASHVDSWAEAQKYLEHIKKEHPKARHWCYGYRGGTDPVTERCSDDGEPTGTAGLPILGAIQGEFLSDTICIVVRYFGGVKLGAGGLIRAYGASARQTLREAPILVLTPKITVHVKVPASFVGVVYELAAKCGGQTSNDEYGVDGTLSIDITCEKENEVRLREELQDATRGTAEIQ
ncbi:hypothetical protein FisN_6Lh356 [Fistulifera solaris]|uniref:Impact N-terminal domain-containing protein n=1 Tax=Fistulifera solaris TaxID=1519565 RepID=A0A1Z5JLB7_FISSO|nr:hypothetical protein FisN_6Lh356 [Fistulifera solaris]|eukprot:GAX14578.1 hypothetical protein FisN_6Lh356 [Fistulifera solaris]